MFKDYDDYATPSSASYTREMIRTAPAEFYPDRWQHMELADSTADSAFTGSPHIACTVHTVCSCIYSDVFPAVSRGLFLPVNAKVGSCRTFAGLKIARPLFELSIMAQKGIRVC